MSFYKSKNSTISERLTGISNQEGFEVARKFVKSGLLGVCQKEANSWLKREQFKLNWWKVMLSIVAVTSGMTTVWAFFFK